MKAVCFMHPLRQNPGSIAQKGAPSSGSLPSAAFTMVEILLVIAIIGIMASLVLTVIGRAARDSHEVVARQQQVVVQEALNAWIANASSQGGGIAAARAAYNAAGSDSAKLALIRSYLGGDTYGRLTATNSTSGGGISSVSIEASGLSLSFSSWSATNYPSVQLQ